MESEMPAALERLGGTEKGLRKFASGAFSQKNHTDGQSYFRKTNVREAGLGDGRAR